MQIPPQREGGGRRLQGVGILLGRPPGLAWRIELERDR